MINHTHTLGDAVKRARGKLDCTQSEIANAIEVDVRTVLNIENYRGNPKYEVLFPLIRALQIDANEIFYPERHRQSSELYKLYAVVGSCSDEEAAFLFPVMESILAVLRGKNSVSIQ